MSEIITRQDTGDTPASGEHLDVRWAPAEPAPRPRRLWLKIGLPVAAVVAAATVCSLVLIAPGTTAAGVPVGGQTVGMAADSISSRLSSIQVSLGDGGPTVSAADLGATVDASGLADECEVQLAYAIGVADPVSIYVDSNGTAKVCESKIEEAVRELFPLTPQGIIKHLQLRRPIFRKTAAGGHFGRDDADFTWESTHRAKELAQAAGGAVGARA